MPNTRLELPDGDWADIRDPKKVAWGRRKPVSKAAVKLARYRSELQELDLAAKAEAAAVANPGIQGAQPLPEPAEGETPEDEAEGYIPNEDELEMLETLQEVATVALVAAWSFEGPVTVDNLQELPGDAASALVEHCTSFIDKLFVNTEPSPDPESPTQP